MTSDANYKKDHSLNYHLRSLLAGGVAGCLAKTLTAPMDRVKILFQGYNPIYSKHSGKPLGVFMAIKEIFSHQGIYGLFQGHSAMLIRIFPSAAIRFMSYEQYRMILVPDSKHNTPWRNFLAGSLAGNTAVLVTYPLEIIRTRLAFEIRNINITSSLIEQNPHLRFYSSSNPYGIWHTCNTIWNEGGGSMRGFYKGFLPTMFGIIPYAGCAFMSYEYLKSFCYNRLQKWTTVEKVKVKQDGRTSVKRDLNIYSHLLVGGLAGMIGQTAAYPFDTVRHRLQLIGVSKSIPAYKSMTDAFLTILRTEGWRGFFIGLSINYWKTIPANAVAFAVYNQMKQFLNI